MRKSIGMWLRKALTLGAGLSGLALAGCARDDGGAAREVADPTGAGATSGNAAPGEGGEGALADELAGEARLSAWRGWLRAAGPSGPAQASPPRTVFAPTNSAFDAFFASVNDGEECAAYLETPPGQALLRAILRYQVVPGEFTAQDIVDALGQQADGSLEVNTALSEGGARAQLVVTASTEGGGVGLALNGGNAIFGGANVVFADVVVSSGILHVVDRLPLSPGVRSLLAGLPADAACRPKPGDLVEVAAANPNFSTLVDLVGSAGLVPALQSPGPFTVFAPSNAAFDELLSRVEDGAACVEFLKNEGKPVLTQILLYHVAAGALEAAQILEALGQEADGALEVATLLEEGGEAAPVVVRPGQGGAALALNGGAGPLGGADVVAVDVEASNGVIHVLNRVLLSEGLKAALGGLPAGNPCRPTPGDLVEVATATPALSTLVDLVSSAGLVPALQSPGPFTVFAPSNAAFDTFLGELNDGAACVEFLKGEGKPVLTQILLYHVVGGALDANAVVSDPDHRLPTLLVEGAPPRPAELFVRVAGADVSLNGGAGLLGGAQIAQTNVFASNGIAHVVNDVLLSRGLRSTLLALPAGSACSPRSN